MTPREETARITMPVRNEGLNDSSRGKCKDINAAVGRRGDTTERAYNRERKTVRATVGRLSDIT